MILQTGLAKQIAALKTFAARLIGIAPTAEHGHQAGVHKSK